MLEAGTLGRILHAEANFSVPSALSYPPDLWRANRVERPAGSVTALGIHMIDALIYLLGPVARVAAQAYRRAVQVDIDDTTSALFAFQSGASGYLGTFFACPHTSYINVYGTGGNALAQIDNSRLTVQPAEGPQREEAIEAQNTLRLELDEFAAACAGQARFTVAPEEAVHGIAVLEALVEAAASSQWVAVAGAERPGVRATPSSASTAIPVETPCGWWRAAGRRSPRRHHERATPALRPRLRLDPPRAHVRAARPRPDVGGGTLPTTLARRRPRAALRRDHRLPCPCAATAPSAP